MLAVIYISLLQSKSDIKKKNPNSYNSHVSKIKLKYYKEGKPVLYLAELSVSQDPNLPLPYIFEMQMYFLL